MKLVGRNNDGTGERMEVLELEKDAHPYFMGAQVCTSAEDKQFYCWYSDTISESGTWKILDLLRCN